MIWYIDSVEKQENPLHITFSFKGPLGGGLFYVTKMPRKPAKPCAYPGCPNLTEKRYCPKHERLASKQYEQYGRDSAAHAERYGRKWRKIRDIYLQSHPLCEECLKEGRYTKATLVHHKKPLADGGTNNRENLMAMCDSCHSRHHAKSGDRWHQTGRG